MDSGAAAATAEPPAARSSGTSIAGWRRWAAPLLLLLAAGAVAAGVYAWTLVDGVAVLPPLVGQPLIVRRDGHGQGLFGAPRNGGRFHRGVDLLAPVGTPVRAMRGGWVAPAAKHQGLGNYVVLRHRGGVSTWYAHLDRVTVAPNQWVRQGQTVGTVGKTGNARARDIAAHLHFEIHEGETPVDPLGYLRPFMRVPWDQAHE